MAETDAGQTGLSTLSKFESGGSYALIVLIFAIFARPSYTSPAACRYFFLCPVGAFRNYRIVTSTTPSQRIPSA